MRNVKILYIVCLLLLTKANLMAQESFLYWSDNSFNLDLIKDYIYKMQWYSVTDSTKINIGSITTKIEHNQDKIYVESIINLKQASTI